MNRKKGTIIGVILGIPLLIGLGAGVAIVVVNQLGYVKSSNTAESDKSSNTADSGNGPSNLVKVLDRVTCHESDSSCDQDEIGRISESCLRDGYVTSLPPSPVLSSRVLKELVSEQITEYGIEFVGDEEKTVEFKKTVKGYCIGSEYVMK